MQLATCWSGAERAAAGGQRSPRGSAAGRPIPPARPVVPGRPHAPGPGRGQGQPYVQVRRFAAPPRWVGRGRRLASSAPPPRRSRHLTWQGEGSCGSLPLPRPGKGRQDRPMVGIGSNQPTGAKCRPRDTAFRRPGVAALSRPPGPSGGGRPSVTTPVAGKPPKAVRQLGQAGADHVDRDGPALRAEARRRYSVDWLQVRKESAMPAAHDEPEMEAVGEPAQAAGSPDVLASIRNLRNILIHVQGWELLRLSEPGTLKSLRELRSFFEEPEHHQLALFLEHSSLAGLRASSPDELWISLAEEIRALLLEEETGPNPRPLPQIGVLASEESPFDTSERVEEIIYGKSS